MSLKHYFNVDIPNLQSFTSAGYSFYNPRTIKLKCIIIVLNFILDIANNVSDNFEFSLDNSFQKVTSKDMISIFYSFVPTISYSRIFEGVY